MLFENYAGLISYTLETLPKDLDGYPLPRDCTGNRPKLYCQTSSVDLPLGRSKQAIIPELSRCQVPLFSCSGVVCSIYGGSLEILQQFQQFSIELVAVEVLVFHVFSAGVDNAERAA